MKTTLLLKKHPIYIQFYKIIESWNCLSAKNSTCSKTNLILQALDSSTIETIIFSL